MAIKISYDELISLVIDILKKNETTAKLIRHPAFKEGYLSIIQANFPRDIDYIYEDNKITAKQTIETNKGKSVSVYMFSVDKLDHTNISPIIKQELFEYEKDNLVQYAVMAKTVTVNNEGIMTIDNVDGNSYCNEQTSNVKGSTWNSHFDSNGIQFLSRGESSTIKNPISLKSNQHYSFQTEVQTKQARIGTIGAYKELASKTGTLVTEHTDFYNYRECLEVIKCIVTDPNGKKNVYYKTIRPGRLQTFNSNDSFVSHIEPLSKEQIIELISLESDPTVREGLKKYVNKRDEFSYNIEQSKTR